MPHPLFGARLAALTAIIASGILAPAGIMRWASVKRDPKFLWFWRMLAPAVAAYLFLDAWLTLATSSVTVAGPGAHYQGAAVYVNWHKYVPFLCVHHGRRHRWLLMSSAPYLEPVALWCRWMGLTVVRSAPGEHSRQSMLRLVEALKCGNSVALAADGPAGPPFAAKPGCVDLARAAGVPVIPVTYRSCKGKSNPKRWDELYQVRKFDQIEICYGSPVSLAPSEPDSAALERVERALNEFS